MTTDKPELSVEDAEIVKNARNLADSIVGGGKKATISATLYVLCDLITRLTDENAKLESKLEDADMAGFKRGFQESEKYFQRVDFYRLAKAFKVDIEEVHKAVGFTGYLYRQLASLPDSAASAMEEAK